METRLSLTIIVAEETIFGECRLAVSVWDDSKLVKNVGVYKAPAVVQTLDTEANVIPWAIAVLRDSADRVIADMLEKFSKGEEKLMHDVNYAQDL